MGIDTQALLTDAPSALDLLHWADEKYLMATLRPSGVENLYHINFKDGEDSRMLSVFVNNSVASDYKGLYTGDATFVSMGCWGNSEVIARKLVASFGGWLRVNDCEDEWTRLDQC